MSEHSRLCPRKLTLGPPTPLLSSQDQLDRALPGMLKEIKQADSLAAGTRKDNSPASNLL